MILSLEQIKPGGGIAPPLFLDGTVTRIGYYNDTLPKLVISFPKVAGDFSWLSPGERHPVTLKTVDNQYTAALRTTLKSSTVAISPDLIEISGRQVRLVDILAPMGLFAKNRVSIEIKPALSLPDPNPENVTLQG